MRAGGMPLVVLGLIAVAALMLAYGRYQDPQLVTPDAVDDFVRLAHGFYVALLVSLGAVAYGLYLYHTRSAAGGRQGRIALIAAATNNTRSRKIFAATFVAYGIFFSLASGTLVYQPELSFSYHYGADIPSFEVIPCCDATGYSPKILAYLTDHTGLQILPVNLVLQAAVSYLVALNVTLAAGAYAVSRSRRGVGSIGAVTGLFIACPTCVGSLLSVFAGAAGGIALSVALVQLQTLLIAVTIPVLLLGPFVVARKMEPAC